MVVQMALLTILREFTCFSLHMGVSDCAHEGLNRMDKDQDFCGFTFK